MESSRVRMKMMSMDVEIVSKEYIRPSSPTPPHLKTHKFSFLDHLMPPVYVPMILLYPVSEIPSLSSSQRSQTLKQCLSETLSRFYPLAGRIKDNVCIDCNDEGAYFIEASVKSNLSEFLERPDLSVIPKFVPPVASSLEYGTGAEVVMIQLTNFGCGGFVIGALVSHMIVDGIAISTFLKAWAATCNRRKDGDDSELIMPNFDAGPTLFPPNAYGAHPKEATMRALYRRFTKKGRCVTTRFVFDASAVAKLKERASSSSMQNPSRVEAISAFIWKCAMAAWNKTAKATSTSRPSLITHAVNLRRRAAPPLSENCIGNFVCLAAALWTRADHQEEELDLSRLVSKMREATTKFNGDLVGKLQGEGGLANIGKVFQEMAEAISSEMDFIGYTSIAYSGVYDANFGWGKPKWVIPVHEVYHEPFFVNVVRLLDTGGGQPGGNGFEAWISLGEDEMAFLERDQDLLAFASLNPSPLQPPHL